MCIGKTPSIPKPPPPPALPPSPPTPLPPEDPTPPPTLATKEGSEAPQLKIKKSRKRAQQQASQGTAQLRIPLNTGGTSGTGLNIPK